VTTPAAIWTPHLQPGERIVWSAAASLALRRADINRQRVIFGGVGAFSALVAIFLAARFTESMLLTAAQPSLLAAFTPLFLIFALAMAVLAYSSFRKMWRPSPAATHFAATDARLLALDANGAIVDELPKGEIDSVVAGGRARTPDIYVLRKDDPDEKRVFAIEHIERPLEAKALIEDAYLSEFASADPEQPDGL
jgi:hypothetical protein